jgi:hypothetical protein
MDQGTESFYSSHPSAVIPNPSLEWFSETSSETTTTDSNNNSTDSNSTNVGGGRLL